MVFYNDTEIQKLNIHLDVEVLCFYLIMLLTCGILWLGCMYEVLNTSHNLLKLRLLELESFIYTNLTNEIPNISDDKERDFGKNIDSYLKYRQNKVAVLDELRIYIDDNNINSVDELSKMLELKHNKYMVLSELRKCTSSNSIEDLKKILEFKLNRYSLISDLRNSIKTINYMDTIQEEVTENNGVILDERKNKIKLDDMINFKKNRINVLDELHNKIKDNDIIDLDNDGNTIEGGIFSNISNYFSSSSSSNSNSNSNSSNEKKNN